MTHAIKGAAFLLHQEIGADSQPDDRIQAEGHYGCTGRRHNQPDQPAVFPAQQEKQPSRKTDGHHPVEIAGNGIQPACEAGGKARIQPEAAVFPEASDSMAALFGRIHSAERICPVPSSFIRPGSPWNADFIQQVRRRDEKEAGQGIAPPLRRLLGHVVHGGKKGAARHGKRRGYQLFQKTV